MHILKHYYLFFMAILLLFYTLGKSYTDHCREHIELGSTF